MIRLVFYMIFILPCIAWGQSGKKIFNDANLHIIRIQTNIPHWFDTLDNDYNNNRKDPRNFPEIDRLCSIEIDGIYIDSAGFRQKGNFSNTSATIRYKKPFKISFDAFKDVRLDGLKNLTLNNATDDPSYLREPLAYRLLRDLGITASRTAFAKLYINNQYWGLYIMVETVDKTFLRDHYGSANNDENLYKTSKVKPTFLKTLHSTNDSDYILNSGLELKTNESKPNWQKLIHFIDVINQPDSLQSIDSLQKYFDVDQYLKILAVEKLIYSWDSYWGGGNNFYLYEHPDGKIRWIPWDYNESFARHDDIYNIIITSPNYLIPSNLYQERPLLNSIFLHPKYHIQYLDQVCNLLHHQFQIQYIDTILYRWHAQIAQAVLEDTNKLYTYEAFEGSLTQELIDNDYIFPRTGIRLKRKLPGLIPFMNYRTDWAFNQLSLYEFPCKQNKFEPKQYTLNVYPNPINKGLLTLSWDSVFTGVSQIICTDALGRQVIEINSVLSDTNRATIDIPRWKPGIYMIKKIDSNGNIGTARLIVY